MKRGGVGAQFAPGGTGAQSAAPRLRFRTRYIGAIPEGPHTYSTLDRDDDLRLTWTRTRRVPSGEMIAQAFQIDGGVRFEITLEHTGADGTRILEELRQKLLSDPRTEAILRERAPKRGGRRP